MKFVTITQIVSLYAKIKDSLLVDYVQKTQSKYFNERRKRKRKKIKKKKLKGKKVKITFKNNHNNQN